LSAGDDAKVPDGKKCRVGAGGSPVKPKVEEATASDPCSRTPPAAVSLAPPRLLRLPLVVVVVLLLSHRRPDPRA
jgi:hypothetical protein